MSDYGFNFSVGNQTLDHMAHVKQQMDQALADLQSQVDPHVQEWVGRPKDEYTEAKRVWHQSAEGMTNALNAARATLGGISEQIGNTEQRNAAMWQNR
ncbi:WXG100 family type VII secretion target [Catenuloplanes japonicus]|uniref:WXG100 family type VII secretion target n=1 Tax=Catenuloplanes japonicus TaxID=33876 RepID=UPI000525A166|nr:WXG100 family type VII secretion target [Catenuloplanes japonicus]